MQDTTTHWQLRVDAYILLTRGNARLSSQDPEWYNTVQTYALTRTSEVLSAVGFKAKMEGLLPSLPQEGDCDAIF